jgi:hypothetical protein
MHIQLVARPCATPLIMLNFSTAQLAVAIDLRYNQDYFMGALACHR